MAELLSFLPAGLEAVVVIVQHVDMEFSSSLTDWLDAQTPLKMNLAREGAWPETGNGYVAGTNDHLILTTDLRFSYTQEPRNNPYRPSVDTFCMSVAEYWPENGVAILLTGMGRDGANGLAILRRAGWYTIAQDEATSVVYGMPKAAKELGAIDSFSRGILQGGVKSDIIKSSDIIERQSLMGVDRAAKFNLAKRFAGATLGIGMIAAAAKGILTSAVEIPARLRSTMRGLTRMEFGGGQVIQNSKMSTERQRALQAIQSAQMNARYLMGSEAQMY